MGVAITWPAGRNAAKCACVSPLDFQAVLVSSIVSAMAFLRTSGWRGSRSRGMLGGPHLGSASSRVFQLEHFSCLRGLHANPSGSFIHALPQALYGSHTRTKGC